MSGHKAAVYRYIYMKLASGMCCTLSNSSVTLYYGTFCGNCLVFQQLHDRDSTHRSTFLQKTVDISPHLCHHILKDKPAQLIQLKNFWSTVYQNTLGEDEWILYAC